MPPSDQLEAVPVVEESMGDKAATQFWEKLLPAGGIGASKEMMGVYVGEALPPVPASLACRIQTWQFVEMSELLPEFWSLRGEDPGEISRASTNRRKRPITQLNTWLQCFAIYTGVMAVKNPADIPELMAYMVAIIRASEDYSGLAWVRYDAAYRRQAAANGNRKWSRINPSLFALCFTGKAQATRRCDLCLAVSHTTSECSLTAGADPDLPTRLKAVEAAVVAFAVPSPGAGERRPPRIGGPGQQETVCKVWNERRCFYRRCRFRHVCSGCTGPHPLLDCPYSAKQGPVRQTTAHHGQPLHQTRQGPYQPPMGPYNHPSQGRTH